LGALNRVHPQCTEASNREIRGGEAHNSCSRAKMLDDVKNRHGGDAIPHAPYLFYGTPSPVSATISSQPCPTTAIKRVRHRKPHAGAISLPEFWHRGIEKNLCSAAHRPTKPVTSPNQTGSGPFWTDAG
jgi:hypothetical protein